MEITWYGTAALTLRQDDAAIAFDPFFGMPVGCFSHKEAVSLPEEDFQDVTDVFVTHGHVDHIYHLPELSCAENFQIHCTASPGKTLERLGVPRERMVPIAPGQRAEAGPFFVTAYQGRHCKFDLPLIEKTIFHKDFFLHPAHVAHLAQENHRYPENGEILLYEVNCDGMRTQILGSLGLDPETDYPTDADLLILPFQGRSDLEKTALAIVRRLRPHLVLLDHYDDAFPPISRDIPTEAFCQLLSEQEHIPCYAMEKGREFHVETEKTLG